MRDENSSSIVINNFTVCSKSLHLVSLYREKNWDNILEPKVKFFAKMSTKVMFELWRLVLFSGRSHCRLKLYPFEKKQILSKKFLVIGLKLTIEKMRKNFIKICRVERLKIQNQTRCRNKKNQIRHFLSFLIQKLTARIVSNSRSDFSLKHIIQKMIFFKKNCFKIRLFKITQILEKGSFLRSRKSQDAIF